MKERKSESEYRSKKFLDGYERGNKSGKWLKSYV